MKLMKLSLHFSLKVVGYCAAADADGHKNPTLIPMKINFTLSSAGRKRYGFLTVGQP